MAEESHVVRGINWRETFPFTNIFRSFRVAIHPSKLILGLLGVLALYCVGRTMDAAWPVKWRGIPDEIDRYEGWRAHRAPSMPPGMGASEIPEIRRAAERQANAANTDFRTLRATVRDGLEQQYAQSLLAAHIVADNGSPITEAEAREAARDGKYLGKYKDALIAHRDATVRRADEAYKLELEPAEHGDYPDVKRAVDAYQGSVDAATAARDEAVAAAKRAGGPDVDKKVTDANKAYDDLTTAAKKTRDEALVTARKNYDEKRKAMTEAQARQDDEAKEQYVKEVDASRRTTIAAAYGEAETEWRHAKHLEGEPLWPMFMDYESARVNDACRAVLANNWTGTTADAQGAGVLYSIYRFATVAPRWAIHQHPLYAIVLLIVFLIVWAVFGGAIARIAAVHVAREEKLSIRQALRFSTGKFLSFIFAPIIPLAIIVVVGLVVAVGGLVANIPFVGPILIGIFFFLALAAGFVMTLVSLGTLGGFNLMYPTIAVEGSDSFDAISRSFSYVYARPWRMLWYTLVAITYGALTFLFVRLFVFLMLVLTHKFAGMWIFTSADNLQPSWDAMWSRPAFWNLPYEVPWLALGPGQKIGAIFISFWVYLVIGLMAAFLVSFYFSSNTVIYYLMRREVDATELDDVYLEQSEEDFADPAGPSGGAPVTPAPGQGEVATGVVPAPGEPTVVVPPTTPVEGGNTAPNPT